MDRRIFQMSNHRYRSLVFLIMCGGRSDLHVLYEELDLLPPHPEFMGAGAVGGDGGGGRRG